VHNVSNALAAAALGHAMGIRIDVIAHGLAHTVGVAMRMQVSRLKNGVTVINDAYNGESVQRGRRPGSAQALPWAAGGGVGTMRELGDESRRAHTWLVSAPPLSVWISW